MLEVCEADKNLIHKEIELVDQGIKQVLKLKLSLVFERLSRYLKIKNPLL